jgi:hypothetical protein
VMFKQCLFHRSTLACELPLPRATSVPLVNYS